MSKNLTCDVAVIGGGPGGYTAAFRAADLGKKVVLIEKESRIGGVCLNVGCIPSKTLLHAAEVIEEAKRSLDYGVIFTPPKIDINQLRAKKDQVVGKLIKGLEGLAKARGVTVIRGTGRFSDEKTIQVESKENPATVSFSSAIIAVGSRPVSLPFIPSDKRIWDSTDALTLPFVPKHLAVLGGGIIGLEMAQVYSALGSKITVVEMMDQIIPPADASLVRPLAAKLKKNYEAVFTSTKVTDVKAGKNALTISLEGKGAPKSIETDALLVAVGRSPNGTGTGADKIGVQFNEKGFIDVNDRMETNIPGLYAIGDTVGNPMLAHKAVHEGKVAAEVIAGIKSAFSALCIPSVAYTDPEIAWVGVTEKQAVQEGLSVHSGVFPWAASGRALSADKQEGSSMALFDKETGRLIGAGLVGARSGDLIAEAALAIEMGADAEDIGKTIHAHPTFAETFAFAAEMAEGTITDLMPPKKK